jgi:hypothetical protein
MVGKGSPPKMEKRAPTNCESFKAKQLIIADFLWAVCNIQRTAPRSALQFAFRKHLKPLCRNV